MSNNNRSRKLHPYHKSFEEYVTSVLESQDKVLERLERKLESPILNGGFDDLVTKVSKIETSSSELTKSQDISSKKIDAIHIAVYDPDLGLYHVVKNHTGWIKNTSKAAMWLGGLLAGGILGGIGKFLYNFLSGHVHFTP